MTQPALTREGINAAVFGLIQAVPGIVTCSRRLRHWADVPDEERPALFLAKAKEFPIQDPSGLPTVWRYEFVIYLYVVQKDQSMAPSTAINSILDAIESALRPVQFGPQGFPGSLQVLGDTTGRIRRAWISGAVETDEGALGDQSIATVPIEVEVA